MSFTAVMNNALTIQFIIVPILKSYPDRSRYTWIMAATFAVTMVFYYYIDIVGAYGIFYNTQPSPEEPPKGNSKPWKTTSMRKDGP